MRTAVAMAVGLLMLGGCGGSKSSAEKASDAGAGATTTTTKKAAFKAVAPGSDPCLLLTEAKAQAALGGPVQRENIPTRATSSFNYCTYLLAGSSSKKAEIGVRKTPETRADYDRGVASNSASRPAGNCEPVPDLGDAATYCASYATSTESDDSYVDVFVGQTLLVGGVVELDGQGHELPSGKAKSIALMRAVLTS